MQSFTAENREALGTASDKLASITKALVDSLDDIKQTLHIAPNGIPELQQHLQPANGALTGALAVNNFTNPIAFLCGAMQAASRLGGEQSAKLCVQYLAPIIKNRQYNFPPLGENLFVGAQARPNEVTYSEDWMRPDYVPPQPTDRRGPAAGPGRAGAPRSATGRRSAGSGCAGHRDGDHRSRGRPVRHDGAAGRWLMRRQPLAPRGGESGDDRGRGRDVRLRLARAEFAAAARHRRATARAPS